MFISSPTWDSSDKLYRGSGLSGGYILFEWSPHDPSAALSIRRRHRLRRDASIPNLIRRIETGLDRVAEEH